MRSQKNYPDQLNLSEFSDKSLLILDDDGKLGVRISNTENIVEFYEIEIVQDSPEGLRATGIPEGSNIIIQGQGFVEEGQLVQVTTLDQL